MKKTINAVIFDMDGVISDTETLRSEAKSEVLSGVGIKIAAKDITARYAGMNSKSSFEAIFRDYGQPNVSIDIGKFVADYWQRVRVQLQGDIAEVKCTRRFINRLSERGLPLAVASGALAEFIDLTLTKLGLKNKFSAVASTYEVENGKPEPDVFLLVAKKLGVAPEFCLVIEDAISGMVAAQRAGMACIGLVNDIDSEKYPADLLVKSLVDPRIEEFFEFLPPARHR